MGQPRGPRRALATALVALLAVQLFVVAPTSGASGTTDVMSAALPSARDGTAAVTLGGYVYVFGGDTGTRTPQIVRYDPVADQNVVMGATLPAPRAGMSAVAADGVAYLFGGWDGATYSGQILRYDPTTDTTTTMGAALPTSRTYTSAVWDGTYAYIFGGGTPCAPCTTDQIVRYDPATDRVALMSATLPTPRYGTSAVWDGSHAYIFGGVTASTSTEHADIVRYDPVSDTTDVLPATLPTPRYHTAAAFLDGRAFVMGGYPCTAWPHYCDEIVAFDPASGTIDTEDTRLTSGRYLTSASARGDHLFILGGYDGTRTSQILRYGPGLAPAPTNHAPVLATVPDLSIITGDTATRHISATDPDGDALTLSMTGLPAGATFTDHGNDTGTLTWHTATGDSGTYALTARADDGRLLASQGFTLYVGSNPPPVLDPVADLTVIEGAQITLAVTASDPQGDPVTLSATGLPTGATFTDHGNAAATLQWSTGYDDAGTHDMTFHASDGTSSDTEPLRITVMDFDRAPVFDAVTPDPAVAGDAYTLLVHATDPDGDPVTLDTERLPSGATFSDLGNGDGRLDWTPSTDQLGAHKARLTATARNTTSQLAVTLDVLPPYAFTLKSESFGFIDAKPGQTLHMTGRLTNTGYHTDTYTFTSTETASRNQGWTLNAPAPLTLDSGAHADVNLTVVVPTDGTYSRPQLHATSTGDPVLQRTLTSIITVPITLDITLDESAPRVSDLGFLSITGRVTATWWDGSPVVGQQVHVDNQPATTDRLVTSDTMTTDATGTIQLDYSLDPVAALPGEHVIEASATRGGRTDSETQRYQVQV